MLAEDKTGHRQRLRERFLANEAGSRSDEAVLELLLAYAIPQRDVQPLAKTLLAKFGDLSAVLAANAEELCCVDGIKTQSATLIKLVDWIRTGHNTGLDRESKECNSISEQPLLFDISLTDDEAVTGHAPVTLLEVVPDGLTSKPSPSTPTIGQRSSRAKGGTGIFGKSLLQEAVDCLPRLPDVDSIDSVKTFLRSNLPFSAETTRYRNADYIVERMFPSGKADLPLRLFARTYADRQELRDVCFYRFCKAESLILDVVEELLLPAIGVGHLDREHLRDYLRLRFPNAATSSVGACASATTNAFVAGGVLRADKKQLAFAFREPLLPSFGFIVHSEFPSPGMYDIASLEASPAIRAMLWNPDRLLLMLYELRNQGLIAKVSEIDSVRQFTTKWDLEEVVKRLVAGREKA